LTACRTSDFNNRSIRDRSYFKKTPPPGTIQIGPNLFIDHIEINNFGYDQYLWWLQNVFGKNSAEYTSALPDQNVWIKAMPCLAPHSDYYLFHSAYRDFPVVGVSQSQALSFANWRADRVFEYILIKAKVLKHNDSPIKENYFSIDKYFDGKLENILPDTSFSFPVFSLPTLENFRTACQIGKQSKFHCDNFPCINDSLKKDATVPIYWPDKKLDDSKIYQLRGNVREWTNEPNISFGGGWTDKLDIVLQKDTFNSTSVNALTGFRLTSKWTKRKSNAP
jgi:hypothetical protein